MVRMKVELEHPRQRPGVLSWSLRLCADTSPRTIPQLTALAAIWRLLTRSCGAATIEHTCAQVRYFPDHPTRRERVSLTPRLRSLTHPLTLPTHRPVRPPSHSLTR